MDNKELEKIYNDAYRSVYWTAMSLLKDEDEAQDIVQETFVTLIDSYDTLKDKSKAAAWLKKTAANKCLDRLRRTRTVNAEEDFFENVEAQPEDFLPDSILESDEKRKIIMNIIDTALSEDIRRTLILFYYDEMTTKEIASLLGIPQGTVLWRLNYAKKKIKKEVEKYEEDNDDKLYAMGIPFLTKLFTKEAENVQLKPIPDSLLKHSASSATAKTAASSAATKEVTGIAVNKIIIGAVSLILAGAVVTGVIIHNKKKPAVPSETIETEEETETEAKAEPKATPTEAADPTEAPAEEAAAVSSTETPGVPNEALFGTWMRDSAEDNTYETMWINEDGTMNIRKVDHDGNEVARTMGTYSVEGTTMTMSLADGTVFNLVTYTVDEDTLTLTSPEYPDKILVYTRQAEVSAIVSAHVTTVDNADLLDTWMITEGEDTIYMTFNADGTIDTWYVNAVGEELERLQNNYAVEGNKISMILQDGTVSATLVYTVDGDTLTMESADDPNEKYVFTRAAAPSTKEYTAADLLGTWMLTDGDTWLYMSFKEDNTMEAWVVAAPDIEVDRMIDTYVINGNELTLTYPEKKGTETFIIAVKGDKLLLQSPGQPDGLLELKKQ